MRIVHVLNPVNFRPDHPLTRAQAVTFEAMRVARQLAEGVDVRFMAVNYEEDSPAVPEFFDTQLKISRSILDVRDFEKKRKLPFLSDLLIRAFEASDAQTAIFTNIDIAPMPYFYSAVAQRVAAGEPCFTVNRRTIAATPDTPDRLAEMWSQAGQAHPGHDCFVFPRAWVPQLDLGQITTGVPWIGFILLANLACLGRDIKVHEDLHLTFHLGDDQAWTQAADLPYREHNAREALAILQRLQARFGQFDRRGYLGQHVTLAEQQVAAYDKAKAAWVPALRATPPATAPEPPPRPQLAIVPGPRAQGVPPKYIFSINSGRAGSEYLAQLLGTARGVFAQHEAEPAMSGQWLRWVGVSPLEHSLQQRMVKAEAIGLSLAAQPPGTVYAETNHMFIKTFYDVVLKAFNPADVDVIILRRHLPSVLKSFINLGYFSDRNRVWPDWMHTLDAQGCVLTPLAPDVQLDPYERAIGYLLDIEARAQRFVESAPGCRIHEVRLEALQSVPAVLELFGSLGLEASEHTEAQVGRRVNDRGARKAEIAMPTTVEYCEHRIQGYLDLCQRRGLQVPTLPQLKAA